MSPALPCPFFKHPLVFSLQMLKRYELKFLALTSLFSPAREPSRDRPPAVGPGSAL